MSIMEKKIPQYEKFDIRFNYDADGTRDCEVAIKKPDENWKTYAYSKVQCYYGRGSVKALTLTYDSTAQVGTGFIIEIKILNNGVQTAYYKLDIKVSKDA